jgi:hypothetical protein
LPPPIFIPVPGYHGKSDNPFFPRLTFDQFDPGLNPPLMPFDFDDDAELSEILAVRPLWEHFEGPNRAGSEGWSNLYVTCRWFRSQRRSLRSKTGIARSGRVNALNIWRWVEHCDRLYYQLHVHLHGTEQDSFKCGFASIMPNIRAPEEVQHVFANAVDFLPDGRLLWVTYPDTDTERRETRGLYYTWTQGREWVFLLRVELDFARPREGARVWLDGKIIGDRLPVTPKRFTCSVARGQTFRLNRWGFLGPSSYHKPEQGGHPDLMYQPRYVDIDDLEIGTWDYAPSQPEATGDGSSP